MDLGLRRTLIRNTDGVIVNYPNNLLANSIITNFSYEDQPMRVRVRFQVNYNVDLERASEVAKMAIGETENVLPDSTEIVVRSLWDDERGHMLSGILMEGRYRIEDVRHRTRIRSVVLKNLTRAFQQEGIALATPRIRIDPSAAATSIPSAVRASTAPGSPPVDCPSDGPTAVMATRRPPSVASGSWSGGKIMARSHA